MAQNLFLYLARKEGRKKAAFALAVILLFFVILELLFRITGLGRQGAERFYQNVFDPLSVPIPGAQNPYVELSEFMNKKGLRGPDFQRRKPEGIYRIVCLGDSTTFSTGEYKDSYPRLLEQILNRGLSKNKYEVINAGIPGTNIYHQRLLFEMIFKGTDPDMVLLMTGINGRKELKAFRDKMKKPFYRFLYKANRFLHRLAFYRVMTRGIKGGVTRDVKDDSQVVVTPEEVKAYNADYIEDLREIKRLSEQWGFKVVVLSSFQLSYIETMQQYGLQPDDPLYLGRSFEMGIDKIIYDFAKKEKWPYIDLTRDFVLLPVDRKGLWNDPHHVDYTGNRLIADRIAIELFSNNLIPPK
jgi:lysophospholipase L1-like esterase